MMHACSAFICLVLAICDLVHDEETIHVLC